MIGTLIGMATLSGMQRYDPAGMDLGIKGMMGLNLLGSMTAGESLTYAMKDGKILYEGFGGAYWDDAIKTPKNMTPMPTQVAQGVDSMDATLTRADGTTKNVKVGDYVAKGKIAKGLSAVGPLASSYFILQGINENGFAGGMDALFLDVATATATMKEIRTSSVANGMVTVSTRLGMFGGLATGIGAYTGFEMGKSIAGVPGGFAGAFAGAKLGSLAARNPMYAGIAAAGLYAVNRAGEFAVNTVSHVIREGNRRGKMRRSIDTAGSTAAFFTRNAVTGRGRAFEAMRKSHLNARSALGMEATMTHMNRSYF